MPKITELPSGIPTTSDVLPLVQGSTTKKATFNDLPIAAATQTALNLKADAANANLTGTTNTNNLVVGGTLSGAGVTKAAVSLGNVDNTSDANKPVSTAQSTAIAAVGGFKNKVRNPKMDIAQRGASFPAANGIYTLDGWRFFTSGTQVSTVSQQADVSATSECQFNLRVQVTTANAAPAAGDLAVIAQNIEGYLVRDLLGNPIAIRFEVKSPKTGTHCVAMRNSGSDRSYILTYTVNATNTWETKTLSLPGGLISAGTWNFTNGLGVSLSFCLMAGASNQTTAGAWQVGNFLAAAGQVNCMDTVGNVFAVTGVQLERDRGQGSTALEHRDIASELALNLRYFEPGIAACLGTATAAAQYVYTRVTYKVTKRSTPTFLQTPVINSNTSSPTPYSSANDSTGFYVVSSAAGPSEYQFNWTASAEL